MKPTLIILGLFTLLVGFGSPRQDQSQPKVCGFTLQGEPSQPTVTGPDFILPLVYVVEQPDSPIEIVSVDLNSMFLSVSNERHSERNCAKYQVHNRSDRTIAAFQLQLMVMAHEGGGSSQTQSTSSLAPGQTVEVGSCNGAGNGGAPENYVRVLILVNSMDLGECIYRPSLRIPRGLGVHSSEL